MVIFKDTSIAKIIATLKFNLIRLKLNINDSKSRYSSGYQYVLTQFIIDFYFTRTLEI